MGWRIHPLRELVLHTEQTDPRVQPDREFQYVDVSAVSHDTLSVVDPSTIRGADAPSRARKLIKAGDIIFATVRPALKRVAIVPHNLDDQLCSTAFCVIRADPSLADAGFLFFTTAYDAFVKRVSEHQRGSSYPAITDAQVLNQWIPLPPLPEQRAIAEVLRAVQRAKEATEKFIAAARQLKASLMKHLFTYGPVPPGQADRVALKEATIGRIPSDWTTARIGDLGEVVTGTTPSTKRPDYYGGPHMFITPGDFGERKEIATTGKWLSDEGLAVCRALPRGAVVVVCIGATIGKTGITSVDGCATNQQCNTIIPRNGVTPEFLYYALTQRAAELPSLAGRAAVPIVNKSNFCEFQVPLAPFAEQAEVAAQLAALDDTLIAEQRRRDALDALFKSLLHHLMTGKLRVGDIAS